MPRLSRIEKLQRATAKVIEPTVVQDIDSLLTPLLGGPPLPTQRQFILDETRRVWFTGPVGAAKTTALCACLTLHAMLLPGSRWFVGRKVLWTLEETAMKDFLTMWRKMGPNFIVDESHSPVHKYWIAPALRNVDGSMPPPSEFVFHSLDDLDKLGSTQFTGIGVCEANEVEYEIVNTLDNRLRHKLPGQDRPVGPFFLRLESNPVTRSHWLHKKFCGEEDSDPVPWGKKYRPMRRENEINLPPGYYDTISEGKPQELILRFIEGECGPDPHGEGVFSNDFAYHLHVGDLPYVKGGGPMWRSWDFGKRRPGCVIAQRTNSGHVNRLLAVLGQNEMLHSFASRVLMMCAEKFPDGDWNDWCDPHGAAKRDVSEKSSHDVLRELGLRPQFRETEIDSGLELMARGLNTIINKRPRSMYDRRGCSILIEGYASGYKWPEERIGQSQRRKPLADGYYEHVMDCDRYLEVGLNIQKFGHKTGERRVLRRIRNPLTGY